MTESAAGGGGRRAAKSAEAFRTISEVANHLDVPQHVLRFWETKFSQIKPLKRGGGRRYYRPEDIELLRRIRALLHQEGYTIKGVQKLLREEGRRLAVGVKQMAIAVDHGGDGAGAMAPRQRMALERALIELQEIRRLIDEIGK